MGRKQSFGIFLRIFRVAFPLFLAPVGSSNPARHSLTLTYANLTQIIMKSYCENTKIIQLRILSMIIKFFKNLSEMLPLVIF